MKNSERFDNITERLDQIEKLIYELKGTVFSLQCRTDEHIESTNLRMPKHDES